LALILIDFNRAREPVNNAALRRAVSYGIDRDQILKTVAFGSGRALDTPIPESLPSWYQKESSLHPYVKQDLAKAKQELAAGGKPGGFKFTFQATAGSPQTQQTAELIKDQLKPLGIDMEIQLIDFARIIANG